MKKIIIIALCILVLASLVNAPPTPHNVKGTVHNADGNYVNRVVSVTINETVTNDFVEVTTNGFGPPVVASTYATTANGTTNDTIIVTAWNETSYGTNSSNLTSTTTTVNVLLNTTRPSETKVTIISPLNNSIVNTSTLFNASVNISIIGGQNGINCEATINFSNTSILDKPPSELYTHSLGNISLGSSQVTVWNVSILSIGNSDIVVEAECDDQTLNFDNVNFDTVVNITTEDTSDPLITILSPFNNSLIPRNITFLYNVSDHSIVSNCSLIVDEIKRDNKTDIIKDATQNFTLYLDFGDYNYSVECSDNSSNFNVGTSETLFINVTDKDLAIVSSDIIFSDSSPVEDVEITINAIVKNIGEENITETFNVQFFDGDPDLDGVQINGNKSVSGLNSSSNISISINWNTSQGTHNIHVLVDIPLDSNGSILEINESNNEANNTIFISAYNIYYGEIGFDIALDSASNLSVFMWFDGLDISGNVFFIDTDSSITWTNLTALGINISGNNATNDFEEADNKLNITGLTDSLNATYTFGGKVRNLDSFLAYSKNITNVPVDNSTNNSNFITGILWDSSDSNMGEYNGSQDLIFTSKINYNTLGAYGIYDYEIKIPANLKKYISPNNENSVTLYTELR